MDAREMEIAPLKKSDTDKAASVVAAAFLKEPGAVALIRRDDKKRLRILRRYYAAQVTLNRTQGMSRCAILDGEMAGVMMLCAPGTTTVTAIGLLSFLWRMLFHVSPALIWRGLKSSLDDERHRPKRPHYYLETIGVDPKFQGRGVGGAMLSYLTGLADREGVLVHLSTTDPRNVPFYEKRGFRIISETDQSGVPNYHMEREPKKP